MISAVKTVYKGYKMLDNLIGGNMSKFAMKNAGNAAGWIGNRILRNRPELKQKISEAVNKIGDAVGDNNELGKNLHNASKTLNEGNVKWRSCNEGDNINSTVANPNAVIPYYNKNLGGTNFKRFRPKFKRVKVKKAIKFRTRS